MAPRLSSRFVGRLVAGVASSLIIRWSDYEVTETWGSFTDHGMFTNHDPEAGRTLYGAEVVPNYLLHDPESLGWAAIIEWLNREAATPEEVATAEARWARWE